MNYDDYESNMEQVQREFIRERELKRELVGIIEEKNRKIKQLTDELSEFKKMVSESCDELTTLLDQVAK